MKTLLLLTVLFFSSCYSLKSDRYETPAEVTGGFVKLNIDLLGAKRFLLSARIYNEDAQSDSITTWKSDSVSAYGKRHIVRGRIKFVLDNDEASNKILHTNIFKDPKNDSIYARSKDTLMVFGFPCVRLAGKYLPISSE
jgi:hypothetical protein